MSTASRRPKHPSDPSHPSHAPHPRDPATPPRPPYAGSPHSFEADIPVPGEAMPVRARICRYSAADMGERQSLALASAAMRLARIGMDVVLGRVRADRLANAVNPIIMRKLDTMSLLYRGHLQRHPEMMRRIRMTVAAAVGIEAVVRSADHLEASVHLRVGGNDYWAAVVFDHDDGRWLCTSLDLG